MYQESKNTDDGLPVVASVVKQFFDQFVQQANKENDKLPDPIHLTNATGTHLHHLNEDCLLQIFSVQSLTLMDLCSLAETCTIFKRIVQHVFPKDLRVTFSSNFHDVVARKYLRSTDRSSQDIERIFKNFGSCLSEVSMISCSEKSGRFVLNLVTEYAKDTLDILRIQCIKIPAIITVKLKPIFKRLQLLGLNTFVIVGDKALFADLNSLIELRVRWPDNSRLILESIFPKLERFTYHGCESIVRNYHPLPAFISRHRSLKLLEVNMAMDVDDEFEMKFLQVIGNSCMELEKLVLYIGDRKTPSFQPLQALRSLNTLKLEHMSCDDFKFIPAVTKLRELHLIGCRLSKYLTKLAFLAQFTKLDIITGTFTYESFDVVDLEELTIFRAFSWKGGLFVLNEETYQPQRENFSVTAHLVG